MALTVTSRGTGTHNTGATTLVPGGRTATLAALSMGCLLIALDNAGAAGAATCAPSSWTDAKGNVWTRRQNALYDNGAASAGIEMAIYTAPITVALLTTDLGTITWDGAVSPVAKAWTWYEVIPSGANTVAYSTGGTIAGATAANATVGTTSVLVGDAVIAGYFAENVAAVTGDADATNGSWTAQQTATIGSTTSGVRIATQQKVQTTTASTQSYDATVASQDRIAGYVMLHEVVNTTVTPGVASLTTAPFAPTVTVPNNITVTPTTVSLATSAFAPIVSTTAHQTLTPGVVALATSAFAPTATASDHKLVTPAPASLTLTGFAPTVTPSNHQTVTPDVVALSLTTFAPTIALPVTVTPDVASLVTAGLAPIVTASDHQTVVPSPSSLAMTAFAPTAVVSDHQLVVPTPASLALMTFAPTVTAGEGLVVTPDAAALTMTAFAPDVVLTDHQRATPDFASLLLSAFAPIVTVTEPIVLTPGPASLTLTTYAPSISNFLSGPSSVGASASLLAALTGQASVQQSVGVGASLRDRVGAET